MSYYRNKGDGTFDDRSRAAGVTDQLGGLVCYQADYDNDGRMDIFIARGAWLQWPIRPTLLRNNGAGGFTDVTQQAGLMTRGQFQRRGMGRLRQRRLARPVHRLRAATEPSLSQQRRRYVRGSRRLGGRARRPIPLLQGLHLDRLRQRRLPRSVPQSFERSRPAVITTIATAASSTRRRLGTSTGPKPGFRAGRGITTMTAGSISSPPATTAVVRRRGRWPSGP